MLAVAREVERLRVLAARVRADELARREIDDADAVGGPIGRRQLRFVDARRRPRRAGERDVEQLAVVRQLDAARTLAHRDARRDLAALRVDDDDLAALLGADVELGSRGGLPWRGERRDAHRQPDEEARHRRFASHGRMQYHA